MSIDGNRAEIDVRGKRIQAKVKDLRVISGSGEAASRQARVRVNVDLKPREGMLSELNVIGMTVDQAVDRGVAFSRRHAGHRPPRGAHRARPRHRRSCERASAAFLKTHPQVEKYYAAPDNQGGGGATIVELKD